MVQLEATLPVNSQSEPIVNTEPASDPTAMHRLTPEIVHLAESVLAAVLHRQGQDPWSLGETRGPDELGARVGQTVTAAGLGAEHALRLWQAHLQPANVAVDHPGYLAFIPHAPTEAAIFFDMLVSGLAIYAGSWLEASGATYAENQALRWLAELAGYPPEAGGTFVQGGTLGNLSALHTARTAALAQRGGQRPTRWQVAASAEAHSSINQAARVLDIDVLDVPVSAECRLTAGGLRQAIAEGGDDGLFAVVASAGATNLGVIDDLAGVVEVCREHRLWLHIDGAYGLGALASPQRRALFTGIEHSDSFIVDPHKWLFAGYDACALVYRDPVQARAAHSQSASYLDALNARNEWNPADYAVQLSRRARGLPFWFSLAAHGTDAYAAAIEAGFTLTAQTVAAIKACPHMELVIEPDLTAIVFRRHGWDSEDYDRWAADLLAAGTAFVMPTRFRGEPAARLVLLNPRTTFADIERVLDAMA
ncbi:MAG: pyridoxal-dependent decarboxylase [Chloroflexota bacterium]|nr:pyridoxal-dependent decarboxylase [Chloroflexota bacterium]